MYPDRDKLKYNELINHNPLCLLSDNRLLQVLSIAQSIPFPKEEQPADLQKTTLVRSSLLFAILIHFYYVHNVISLNISCRVNLFRSYLC